ncbi:uncharacterized protein LOC141569929 isoform X3 [Rhinolophus sinicus]|uniref:uncharacterized protein LOC141569929 isoform X3 n=1 Tax=Rhinolophus sinicus TaxID=89399 RepID=UPI003D7C0973
MLVYLHLSEKENYATQLRCSFITWTESDRHRAPSGHFSNPGQNGSPRGQQPGPVPTAPVPSWPPSHKTLWLLPPRSVALAVLLQPLLPHC